MQVSIAIHDYTTHIFYKKDKMMVVFILQFVLTYVKNLKIINNC